MKIFHGDKLYELFYLSKFSIFSSKASFTLMNEFYPLKRLKIPLLETEQRQEEERKKDEKRIYSVQVCKILSC